MEFNFVQTKRIETDRLVLRYICEKDTHDIFVNIANNKEVLKYFLWNYVENEKDFSLTKLIESSIKNRLYFNSIIVKETQEVIGIIFTRTAPNETLNSVEIGFALGQKFWNKGYMSEALKSFSEFLLTTGVHKLVVGHIEENVASAKVIQKCGFLYESKIHDELFYHGRYWNTINYYLINKD